MPLSKKFAAEFVWIITKFERIRHGRWLAVCLACCLVAGQGLAVGVAPELPDPGNPQMSRDQQGQLGLQVAGEVYKQMPVLPDSSRETQYIQKLGKRLAATIPPERSWPFQFHVIAQKEINAFALPGGSMFVNIGTIQAADNEAELAGVMAHEMAHVYMQHSAKQQEKASLLGGLAGIAGGLAGRMGGVWGTLAQSGIQFGAGTLMLKYSRGDEAQADAVGAIILWKANYNPVALADFFEKIEKQGSSGPQFLSDHPNPGNRRAAIQQEIAEWPARKYGRDSRGVRRRAQGRRERACLHRAGDCGRGQERTVGRREPEEWGRIFGSYQRRLGNRGHGEPGERWKRADCADHGRAAELDFPADRTKYDEHRAPGELGCNAGAAGFGDDRAAPGRVWQCRGVRRGDPGGAAAEREHERAADHGGDRAEPRKRRQQYEAERRDSDDHGERRGRRIGGAGDDVTDGRCGGQGAARARLAGDRAARRRKRNHDCVRGDAEAL